MGYLVPTWGSGVFVPERVPPIGLADSGLNGNKGNLFALLELLGLLLPFGLA